jgi:hypothetical protein
VQFGEKDVVRHNLVQQIIRAYEEHDAAQPRRAGSEKVQVANKEAAKPEIPHN